MWPPPLSFRASALLKPTHEVWCRVRRVWTHRFGSPHSGQSSKHVPSKPCSLKHVHMPSCHALGTQCPHLCHALHTGDLGHALTNLGASELKKYIAMLMPSQAAEETWSSCHTAGTGPVPLESLALDWMAFSSSEGLQTQPVSCFILSDGASISTLLPVAFNPCPQGRAAPDPVQGAKWDRDS